MSFRIDFASPPARAIRRASKQPITDSAARSHSEMPTRASISGLDDGACEAVSTFAPQFDPRVAGAALRLTKDCCRVPRGERPQSQSEHQWMATMGEQDTSDATFPHGERVRDDFEWVNDWALQGELVSASVAPVAEVSRGTNLHTLRAAFVADAVRAATELEVLDEPAAANDDQVRRDLFAIERARDALVDRRVEYPALASAARIAPRRTSDTVPVVIGSMLGALMLVVVTAAATVVKLAR